jgi:hypothetical protein
LNIEKQNHQGYEMMTKWVQGLDLQNLGGLVLMSFGVRWRWNLQWVQNLHDSATGSQRRDFSEEDMLQIEWRINGGD